MVSYTVLDYFLAFFQTIFKVADRYALGVFGLHTGRFFEQMMLIGIVSIGGGFMWASFGLLLGRLINLLCHFFYIKVRLNHFSFSMFLFDYKFLKRLLLPAVGFTLMPMTRAIFVQGFTVIAATVSGEMAAIFTTVRVFVFNAKQLALGVPRAIWPELSKVVGRKEIVEAIRMLRFSLVLTLVIYFVVYLICWFLGPVIFEYWTAGEITFDYQLFLVLGMSTAISCLNEVFFMFIASFNAHARFAKYSVLVAEFFYFLSLMVTTIFELDCIWFLVPLVAGEMMLVIYFIYDFN
jgi:O-antigen/teichoic acid export membrane protein